MFYKRSLIVAVAMLCGSVLQAQGADQYGEQTNNQMAPAQSQIQWFTNYQDAVARAKAEKKSLVLFFTGSDWCGWCKKMETEVLCTPDFIKAAGNNFVFVELDFPMSKTLPAAITSQNAQLKQKYGITGYPTIIVLDSNENFIAETGYRPGGGKAYADYLNGLIRN